MSADKNFVKEIGQKYKCFALVFGALIVFISKDDKMINKAIRALDERGNEYDIKFYSSRIVALKPHQPTIGELLARAYNFAWRFSVDNSIDMEDYCVELKKPTISFAHFRENLRKDTKLFQYFRATEDELTGKFFLYFKE